MRAFDARTGAQRWSWDPIPNTTAEATTRGWTEESARRTGAANAWSMISVDAGRGLIFVPTGSASPDFYGGERPGLNNFANSLVALRAETGELVWHRQLVHHDLWDYDLAAQPMLIDFEREGKAIPAVVQATKTGMLFVFDRETGEPVLRDRGAARAHLDRAWRGRITDSTVSRDTHAGFARRGHSAGRMGPDGDRSRTLSRPDQQISL